MKEHLGAYYRLGGIFSTLIGKPAIMKTATRLGLPRKDLMYLVLKLLAGLYDTPRRRLGRPDRPLADQDGAQCVAGIGRIRSMRPEEGRAMLSSYLPIVILLIIVAGFAVTMVTVVTDMLGPRRYNRAKLDAYECGIEPTPLPAGTAGRFPIKFYLTAMLFIVFDIEIVFLYPWAQSAIPLGVLGSGRDHLVHRRPSSVVYAYAWRRGGLDWD